MSETLRKLTVTSCEILRKGTSTSGRDWTMYEVFAVDEAGVPIEAKLRAFDPLPLNELREWVITKREDSRHGTSYTLSYPKGAPRPKSAQREAKDFKGQIADLRLQMQNLEQRFEWLLGELHKTQAASGQELSSPPADAGLQSGATVSGEMAGAAAGAGSGGALASDSDIPF